MGEQEREERAAVVAETRRWIGTPYHPEGDVCGLTGGVDCGMILVRVFCDTGLVRPFDPRPYPSTWMLHQDEEKYLDIVRALAAREYDPRETPPEPGDVVVWRYGKTFSHGAIVTGDPHTGALGWPWVTHAFADAGVVLEESVEHHAMMRLGGKPRPLRAFSYWPAS